MYKEKVSATKGALMPFLGLLFLVLLSSSIKSYFDIRQFVWVFELSLYFICFLILYYIFYYSFATFEYAFLCNEILAKKCVLGKSHARSLKIDISTICGVYTKRSNVPKKYMLAKKYNYCKSLYGYLFSGTIIVFVENNKYKKLVFQPSKEFIENVTNPRC